VPTPTPQPGFNPFDILTSAASKNMSTQDYVKAIYLAVLGRQADPGGLEAFTGHINTGRLTREATRLTLINSAEFLGVYAADNRSWVKVVYKAILRRDADAGGENNWVQLLASGKTRAFVMQQLLASPEYKNAAKD
jgi:hypothetical protein